jgi:hypothetical protein
MQQIQHFSKLIALFRGCWSLVNARRLTSAFYSIPCRRHGGSAEKVTSTVDEEEIAKFGAIGKGNPPKHYLYVSKI